MIVLGKGFFQVSDVWFKQQFQWPLWFLFQTKGSNLVQGYHCLLPALSFVLLGFSLSLPRIWLCPLLGQQHLSPMTLRSAVLAGVFLFFHCLFHIFSAVQDLFFFLWAFLWVSLFCLIYTSVFMPYQTLSSLLYLLSLSVFSPLRSFLSFLSPFIYHLLTFLFLPLFVILFIPSLALSFLISHSVYCLTLLSSWHFFSKLFLWLLSFSSLTFTYFLLKYYICVCIRIFTLHIFHSPAENKKLLMLIAWSYFIPFSAAEMHYSCPSSNRCIG